MCSTGRAEAGALHCTGLHGYRARLTRASQRIIMSNPPDLAKKDLSHVNLATANLAGADLHEATLARRHAQGDESGRGRSDRGRSEPCQSGGGQLTERERLARQHGGCRLARCRSRGHESARRPPGAEPSSAMRNGRPPRRRGPTSPRVAATERPRAGLEQYHASCHPEERRISFRWVRTRRRDSSCARNDTSGAPRPGLLEARAQTCTC